MASITLGPHQAGELLVLLYQAEPATVVELEPGTYRIPRLLLMKEVSLLGKGRPWETVLEGGLEDGSLISVAGDASTVRLERLTLRRGRAVLGGGVMVSNDCTLKMTDCWLSGHSATRSGGALFLDQGQLIASRCVLQDSEAPAGAAVTISQASTARIARSVFMGNTAQVGGALMVNGAAQVTVESCTFVRNRATLAEEPGGSAIALLGSLHVGPQVQVANCLFADPRPLANRPPHAGILKLASSLLPPGSTAGVDHLDQGENLEVATDLIEVEHGLPALRPGAPGSRHADASRLKPEHLDVLGRPLLVGGAADLGALAAR